MTTIGGRCRIILNKNKKQAVALILLLAVTVSPRPPALHAAGAGALDQTFGTDGYVLTPVPGEEAHLFALALQPSDQKLVGAGIAGCAAALCQFGLVRYLPNGSLDGTFGNSGLVTTAIGAHSSAFAVAVAPGDKILAAGYSTDALANGLYFTVARYLSNGQLDSSFGGDGTVTTDNQFFHGRAFSVVVQPWDGKIVAAGLGISPDYYGKEVFALVRYETNGDLDQNFGEPGGTCTDNCATGCTCNGGPRSGRPCLDNTECVTPGIVLTDILSGNAYDATVTAIALQNDHKIVAVGGVGFGATDNDVALARYTATGSLDASFAGGIVVTDVDLLDKAFAVLVQPDQKIVVAGFTSSSSGSPQVSDFLLVRYTTAGSPDPTFGTGGVVITDFANYGDEARALVRQPDNKLVAVGVQYVNGPGQFSWALARYSPTDGALDPTFGNNGRVTSIHGVSQAALVQPDGKLVAAGYGGFNGPYAVARYCTEAGDPDCVPCGDGNIDLGEQCDPGPDQPNDCCTATCQFEPSGSACAPDGNPCTDDVCDGAGGCGVPGPPGGAVCGNGVREGIEECDGGVNCSGCFCTGGGPDSESVPDGVLDSCDNCPSVSNPDQRNADAAAETTKTGDVCDPCPADPADLCDPTKTAAGTIGPTGGMVSTVSGLMITMPPGAVCEPTSVSITGGFAQSSYGIGNTSSNLVGGVAELGPEGLVFQQDVTVKLAWLDGDNDGLVNKQSNPSQNSTINEKNLDLWRNGHPVGTCSSNPGVLCSAGGATDPDVLPCPIGGGNCDNKTCNQQGCPAGSALCCDQGTNTWTLKVRRFSEFAIGVDPCAEAITDALLKLTKLDTPVGDDRLTFKGRFTLPSGTAITDLDPAVHGLRLVIADRPAIVVDATLPAGTFDRVTRIGWKVNSRRTRWTYRNAATPPGGIVKAVIRDKSSEAPGLVKFKFKGKRGTYGATPTLEAQILLPDAEPCFTARFPGPPPAPVCIANQTGRTLKCQ